MLRGQELSEEEEEASGFEKWQGDDGESLPLTYNPDIPIETFDFIVTDECHRSISGLLAAGAGIIFDASIIGLTATPLPQAHAGLLHTRIWSPNTLTSAPSPDGVSRLRNLPHPHPRHRAKRQGRDRRGPASRSGCGTSALARSAYEQLDAELEYTAKELDRSVVNPNQIRTVLQTYKDRVFTELFPDRSGELASQDPDLPPKDDNHAEEIVHACPRGLR